MRSFRLNDSLTWTGVLDPDLRTFDIVMMTEFGTTYNSYVLKGSEKSVIFETAKLKFWDQFKENVENVMSFKELDYIIVNHTEPDHAGSLEKILEINPTVQVVGTATAISFLKEIVNHEFYSIIVKDGMTLSLGNKTLKFMILPNLHWPDTMYTYVEEDKLLFTCDSFGSHYSHDGIVRSTVTNEAGYLKATKYYFDNIIGPYKNPYMTDALERIKDLDIKMICPGHGPVLDSKLDEIMSLYHQWCAVPTARENKLVVIPYVSAYGYTKELAEHIAAGVKECGGIDVHTYDMVETSAEEVLGEIAIADGILFGTPTIIGEALNPIWQLTISMFPPVHGGKLASAFGSYGWSGEGVPHIIERLKQIRLRVLDDGFTIRFKPSEVELLDAFDYGYNFGCILLNKRNDRTGKKSGGKQLVKCLVCGETFDASIEVCPVCGAGPDKFVEVDDTTPDFRKDTLERFVIIGGGAAGFNAAKAIRERNASASIVMITMEPELPYNRPMLTKALLADFNDNQLAIDGPEWYMDNKIDIKVSTTVQRIDVRTHQIITDNGVFDYDKLVYTLGAKCFVVPIPGATQDHVISVRNIADAQNIQRRLAAGARDIVVIGGGVMGLESAWELKKGGCNVTVLETAPRLLPRQLDTGASDMLAKCLERAGIAYVTGAKITEITPSAVYLEDGRSFPAQLVVLSTGMRPYTEVAAEAGIKIDKLIVVDDHMRTSEKDIYAAGDCTEFEGGQAAFWAQAVEMGRIAGANAAGDDLSYETIPPSMVINAMNTSIFALGDNGSDSAKQYRTVEIKDDRRLTYEKFYFYNNVLVGVMLIGDTSRMIELTTAIQEQKTFNEVMK